RSRSEAGESRTVGVRFEFLFAHRSPAGLLTSYGGGDGLVSLHSLSGCNPTGRPHVGCPRTTCQRVPSADRAEYHPRGEEHLHSGKRRWIQPCLLRAVARGTEPRGLWVARWPGFQVSEATNPRSICIGTLP